MKFTAVAPLAALLVFAALPISAFAGVGLVSVRNETAQPGQEDSQPNVIGSPSDRALLGKLQQVKIRPRVMLADAACSSACRFYGGQY